MGKYLPNQTKNCSLSPKTYTVNCFYSIKTCTFQAPFMITQCCKFYQISLYQHINFMHKVSNNVAPLIFNDMFKKHSHKYPTNFSKNYFSLQKCSLNNTKYSISFRGPKL